MLCLQWLATGLILSSHDVKSSMEVDFTFFWFILMVYTFIEPLSYPSEASQLSSLVLTLVDPKPRPCHPNKGCSF